jgi:hypothetical protein
MASRRARGIKPDVPVGKTGKRKAAESGAPSAVGDEDIDLARPSLPKRSATSQKVKANAECGMCEINASACETWGEIRDGDFWGVFCHPCNGTWFHGYSYLTKEECIQKAKTDSTLRACFQSSKNVREQGEFATVRLAEVARDLKAGYRVKRRFLGYNKVGFKSKYNREPAEVGCNPVELRDDLGDNFHCYLVEEDEVVPRIVEFYCEATVFKTDFDVRPLTTLHAEQATNFFAHVSAEPKDSLVRKLQKCMPHNAIMNKIAEIQEKTEAAVAAAAAADAHDSDEGDSSEAGEPDDIVEQETAAPAIGAASAKAAQGQTDEWDEIETAASGSQSARRDRKNSRSPLPRMGVPAPSSRGGSVTGGSKRGSATSVVASDLNSPASKAGAPARNVDEHIAKLNLTQILAGQKIGVERRWAQQFYDRNRDEDVDCSVLGSHLKAVSSAVSIAEKLSKLTDDELKKHVATLDEHGADWPSRLKIDFVDRGVADWLRRPNRYDTASELLDIIVPWIEKADQARGEAARSFSPLKPRAAECDGSVDDKSKQFKQTFLKKVLVPSMQRGAELSNGVLTLCTATLHRLENIDDIDEAYGKLVAEFMMICRCVASILSGRFMPACTMANLDTLK